MSKTETAKIETFTQDNWKVVAADLVKAVESVGKRYGVTFEKHGGQINRGNGIFKLKATIDGSAEADYLKYATKVGLPADGLGKTFIDGRHSYTIVGFEPFKTYPILTKRGDGQSIQWKVGRVVELLKAQVAA